MAVLRSRNKNPKGKGGEVFMRQQQQQQDDARKTTTATATEQKQQQSSSDLTLWMTSQFVDYSMCLVLCYSQTIWGIPWILRLWYAKSQPLVLNIVKVLVLQGLLGIGILHIREQIHFCLLKGRISPHKDNSLSSTSWWYVFQTLGWVQIWMALLDSQQWIDRPTDFTTFRFWWEAYTQYYTLLLLRDVCFMWPFHSWFHDNKNLYQQVHKTHHQILKQAQGMHAFHIDFVDLIVENLGVYPVFLLVQKLLFGSNQIGVHWFALSALLAHDGALHSINPHSSLYFNPILDYFLKPNIHHQLHHALNDGYMLFIPFQHLLLDGRRQKDMDKYNEIYKTNFRLA